MLDGSVDELHGDELVAALLEAGDDLADESCRGCKVELGREIIEGGCEKEGRKGFRSSERGRRRAISCGRPRSGHGED